MSLLIKKILSSIKNIYAKIDTVNEKIRDSGWQTAVLTEDFKPYSNNNSNMPRYRKIGKIVHVWGIVSPSLTIQGGTETHTIFNLPNGYIPSSTSSFLCQGSGLRRWLLTINANGDVSFSRYGTDAYADADDSVWLPFTVTFFVD